MHILGKVLLGFVMVAAIAAIVLTTMVLDVRNHWLGEVDKAEKAYNAVAANLENWRIKVQDENEVLDRAKQMWGNAYNAPNSSVTNPNQGTANIGVGRTSGLAVPQLAGNGPLPVVYAFNVDPNGESQYVGAFQLQNVGDNSSTAQLIRPPFANETFANGTWRIRDDIDPGYATEFLRQSQVRVETEAILKRELYDVKRLNEQKIAADEIFENRRKELEGDPDLADASTLQKDGLVQAIRVETDRRDVMLERLDSLRRRLELTRQQLDEVLLRNLKRRQSLYDDQPPYSPPAEAEGTAVDTARNADAALTR
ncbi:MAG: hypothetical protein R3C01_08755 [Planctomycetaceae bacterium]